VAFWPSIWKMALCTGLEPRTQFWLLVDMVVLTSLALLPTPVLEMELLWFPGLDLLTRYFLYSNYIIYHIIALLPYF
jgi:hypothetical protein